MANLLETCSNIRIELKNILESILRTLQSENLDENLVDSISYRLDWVYNTVVRYADLHIVDERFVHCIGNAKRCVEAHSAEDSQFALVERVYFAGERGRPRLQIPCENLRFLLEKNFKVAEIANIYGTSKSTIERRMKDLGLSARAMFSSLSDEQLDEIISEIQHDFPNIGCKRMTGLLRARDVNVQQSRIRQSMRRVDPEGTLLRALEINIIHRRRYNVAGPLSLWHIDGNHKLIR